MEACLNFVKLSPKSARICDADEFELVSFSKTIELPDDK